MTALATFGQTYFILEQMTSRWKREAVADSRHQLTRATWRDSQVCHLQQKAWWCKDMTREEGHFPLKETKRFHNYCMSQYKWTTGKPKVTLVRVINIGYLFVISYNTPDCTHHKVLHSDTIWMLYWSRSQYIQLECFYLNMFSLLDTILLQKWWRRLLTDIIYVHISIFPPDSQECVDLFVRASWNYTVPRNEENQRSEILRYSDGTFQSFPGTVCLSVSH